MPDSKFSPLKLIFLSVFLVTSHSFAEVTKKGICRKNWGNITSTMEDPETCSFKTDTSGEPASFSVLGFRWNSKNDVLSLKLKIDQAKSMRGLKLDFYYKGSLKASYELPLYTDPEYNLLQEGLWTTLSIPRSQLKWHENIEETFKDEFDTLKVFVSARKDESFSINIAETIFDHRNEEGRISITFDDGYASNFTAAEIMHPYNLTGTAFLIANAFGKKGHLTSDQIAQMRKWGWSLSAHHETPVTEIKDLKKELTHTKSELSKISDPKTVTYFALPLGKYNPQVFQILKEEFKVLRMAGGGFESLPVKDPYRLKTINVIASMTPDEVFELCKKAIANREWAILMFHYLDTPEKGDLNYSSENYKILMKKLSTLKPFVKPIDWVI